LVVTAVAEGTKKITLTPASFKYVMFLFDEGADKDYVPVRSDADSNVFTELQKKGVLERKDARKGRGGSRGRVHLLVDKDSLAEGSSRAPRGSKGTSGPRKPREANPNDDYLASGAIIIQASEIQNIKDSLTDYLAETTPAAQREYELRRSRKTSPSEIARLANQWDKEGISDEEVGFRLTELLAAKDTPFHAYLVSKYGRKMVHLLGYRDDVPDTPDTKRRVIESVTGEVAPAKSNGKLTAPKTVAEGSKATR
jgi:hypothetical protein